MRVLLLGAASSIHLQRWANALAAAGLQVHCVSMHEPLAAGWHASVQMHSLSVASPAGYLLNAPAVRGLMRRLRADLLHAHYASGYGLLGTVSGCRPRLVSVWGSDVFEFPERSRVHRALLRWVLASADAVACTSQALLERSRSLVGNAQRLVLTPFGIDLTAFTTGPARTDEQQTRGLTIGSTKGSEPVYGADLLLRAFARLVQGSAPTLRLRIAGAGDPTQQAALQTLAQSLGVHAQTDFIGVLAHADVPAELRRLDVFVAPSREESFGVAVLEASACGVAVVASRVGGLPEVVVDGHTGLLVPPDDVSALTNAIARLLDDPALRKRMAAAGPDWVASRYAWPACVQTMLGVYRSLVAPRA